MTGEMIQAKGNIMQHPGPGEYLIAQSLQKALGSALLALHQQMGRTSSRKRTSRLYSERGEKKKESCPHVKATFQAANNYELLYSFIYYNHHASQAKR